MSLDFNFSGHGTQLAYVQTSGQYVGNINSNDVVKTTSPESIPTNALVVINRTAFNSDGVYVNGVLVSDYGNDTQSSEMTSLPFFIGAANYSGTPHLESDDKIVAWFAGASLTISEQNILKTIIETYNAELLSYE